MMRDNAITPIILGLMRARRIQMLLVVLIVGLSGVARAESFRIVADAVSASVPAIKKMGLDGMMLPSQTGQILRGSCTPEQVGVLKRSFSLDKLDMTDVLRTTTENAGRVQLPADNGKRPISLSVRGLPDGKIAVKVWPDNASTAEEATMEAGQTLVLSRTGETDMIEIFLVTVS